MKPSYLLIIAVVASAAVALLRVGSDPAAGPEPASPLGHQAGSKSSPPPEGRGALPEGHPALPQGGGALPPGHPPLQKNAALPEDHPAVAGSSAAAAEGHPSVAPPTETASGSRVEGTVVETIEVDRYTYVKFDSGVWAAVPSAKLGKGDRVRLTGALEMRQFRSSTLDRTFDRIYFGQAEVLSTSGASPNPAASEG